MHHRMPVENGASRTQIVLQEHPVREPDATPTCSEHLMLLLLRACSRYWARFVFKSKTSGMHFLI